MEKEIINQLYKLVKVFGSVHIKDSDDKWITVCKITKNDIEQLEKDLDEYEQLKGGIEMTSNKTSEECEPMVSPERYHEAQHEIETLKEIIIELNKKILELKNLAN